MSVKNINKLKDVCKSGLCTRCGTCVGLSGGRISFEDKLGICLPKIPDDLDETIAARIWAGCSAQQVSFPELNRFVFGKGSERHPYLGYYNGLFIGNCSDDDLRKKCSSGGIITLSLLRLLETRKITGAVVLGMNPEKPWETLPFIAKTKDEIISAAGSKYYLSPMNIILDEIERHNGSLAYVGLPCQVHSIQKLKIVGDPTVQKIEYIIGLFCGNILLFSSIYQ